MENKEMRKWEISIEVRESNETRLEKLFVGLCWEIHPRSEARTSGVFGNV